MLKGLLKSKKFMAAAAIAVTIALGTGGALAVWEIGVPGDVTGDFGDIAIDVEQVYTLDDGLLAPGMVKYTYSTIDNVGSLPVVIQFPKDSLDITHKDGVTKLVSDPPLVTLSSPLFSKAAIAVDVLDPDANPIIPGYYGDIIYDAVTDAVSCYEWFYDKDGNSYLMLEGDFYTAELLQRFKASVDIGNEFMNAKVDVSKAIKATTINNQSMNIVFGLTKGQNDLYSYNQYYWENGEDDVTPPDDGTDPGDPDPNPGPPPIIFAAAANNSAFAAVDARFRAMADGKLN